MSKRGAIFNRRTAILIFAALLPIIVVLLVRYAVDAQEAFTASAQEHNKDARDIAADLSAELNQIALLVIGGCAILFREQHARKVSSGFLIAAVVVFSTAVASCFAGFRYRYVLAQQIAYEDFDFDRISNRLDWQTWLLILALSALIVLALLAFLPDKSMIVQSKPSAPAGDG